MSGEPTEDPAAEAANAFLLNQRLKEQEEEAELQAYLDRLQAEREKRENELLCPLDDLKEQAIIHELIHELPLN